MNLEDYSKYYIQGSDHYLIPKDVFKELFNEMLNWKEESIELNKKYVNAVADYETTMAEKKEIENQQKEFIEYLENMLENENDIFSAVRVKDVLSKYKEIIGDVR